MFYITIALINGRSCRIVYLITSSEAAVPDVPEHKKHSDKEVCVIHRWLANAKAALAHTQALA